MLSTRRCALALATTLSLAACDSPSAPENSTTATVTTAATPDQRLPAPVPVGNTNSPVETAKVEADYLGKWVGPEGLVLDIRARPGGGVAIANQWTLDDKGNFEGSVTAEGLRFMRNGEAVTATPSDGDATGMKWLAGKKDCLTVKVGSEGYCR